MAGLLIISDRESDLSALLQRMGDARLCSVAQAAEADLMAYDSVAVLGGTRSSTLTLPIDLRLKIEAYRETGRPMLLEWCSSFERAYVGTNRADSADRLVYIGEETSSLRHGDLLEHHDNPLAQWNYAPAGARPILYNGGHVMKHDRADADTGLTQTPELSTWSLWSWSEAMLVCSFRICDFVKARFAPQKRWLEIVRHIARHLGLDGALPEITPYVWLWGQQDIAAAFRRGMDWIEANSLIQNGLGGVYEGLSHQILPDGTQKKANGVRTDCAGEVGGAFFFDHLLYGKAESLTRFRNLASFCFDKMQCKEGPQTGMLRWHISAWDICYQDDAARAMLGALLYMKFTGSRERMTDVESALDFLVSTTGTDGLRVAATGHPYMDAAKMERLHTQPSAFPCAHFNGYYMAVLLLAYQLCGKQSYLDTAVKGMTSLMAAYPDTIREHSETQELCRLILPLACLYETTREATHRSWLDTVTARLEELRHESGGYVEYDTGYKANRSRTANTESSLLADNGDPVCDLLYSSNWLPLGFAYAWYVTGDALYRDKWQRICRFLAACQLESSDSSIRGAWARSVDMQRMENYGLPHDMGWGACCVESGWTVAEILMGMGMGMALEQKRLG